MIAALALFLQTAAAVTSLSVHVGTHVTTIPVVSTQHSRYVPAAKLVSALNGAMRETSAGHYTVTLGGSHLTLTDGDPFVRVDSSVVPLTWAPLVIDGTLYVPYQVVADVIPHLVTGFLYDRSAGEMRRADDTASQLRASSHFTSHRNTPYIVVVDAGHGGVDPGMSGPIGGGPKIYEKNITLAIAKLVAKDLRADGAKVVMTRTTDTLIALADRGRIANRSHGDVFISIHVNATGSRGADAARERGYETYFLAEAKTEDARRVEKMENEAVRFETGANAPKGDPLNYILHDMAQNEHLRESDELAQMIQDGFHAFHPGPDRGVQQANFAVLRGSYMPAVLIEVGFGTNAKEAAYISDSDNQHTLAQSITESVLKYLDRYEARVQAGGSVKGMAADLRVTAAGVSFQNPVLLAAGTADYGDALAPLVDLDALGGIVTKAVSVEPRRGNAAPRVAEFEGGMINAVGLANPGAEAVKRERLPWLRDHLRRARVIVNVVGNSVDDFITVVRTLDDDDVIAAYELNVSCPNVKAGGLEFGADPAALASLVAGVRGATRRPLFVKLSPTLSDVAATAKVAVESGADGITVVNTMPGLVIDVERRAPGIGFGTGGVSGPGLLPIGVLATWKVHSAVQVPVIGVGGVASATDALQYVMAGASLVAVGTAAMRDPRLPERIVRDLASWCSAHGVASLSTLTGTLAWPS